jgi:predicted RNA-binding Zn-ribbon protein involved in translation (DUF1610 family)
VNIRLTEEEGDAYWCPDCGEPRGVCKCEEIEGDLYFEDESWELEDSGTCPYCGQVMIDDMEVGQGYCVTAPCWMWGTGLREEAMAWEEEQHKR